jgi:Fic family protein
MFSGCKSMTAAPERAEPSHSPASSLLDGRALAFLHESNAIEDIHCFDYSTSRIGALHGHAAAFLHSQRLGKLRRTMSALDLCYWQQLIVLEQRQANITIPEMAVGKFRSDFVPFNVGVGTHVPPSFTRVPELMHSWMRDLRTHLLDDAALPGVAQLADVCGDTLQRFQSIHPFVDGNGRVGRLLVNYLLTYWQQPIMVFGRSERDTFFAAHRSRAKMRQFMRHKLGV